jgi:hypothetical protein
LSYFKSGKVKKRRDYFIKLHMQGQKNPGNGQGREKQEQEQEEQEDG